MSKEQRADKKAKKNIFKPAADAVKHGKANAAAIALAAVTAGIIIIPPLIRCAFNNGEMNCRTYMYEINTALASELRREAKEGGDRIQRAIEDGEAEEVILMLDGMIADSGKFDASDYYFIRGGDRVELRCKKHDTIIGIGTIPSSIPGVQVNLDMPDCGGEITLLTVEGQSAYKPSDISADAGKTVFKGCEIDSLINNLTVTAHYAGGGKKELERGNYIVTCDKLDLNAPGGYTLTVRTKSHSVWNNAASAKFKIELFAENAAEPTENGAVESGA